ncbi:3-deoxy-7-phosphoheptulonate synthase [Salinicola acroporae]|uniref:Phospho-2-dehydro-3-deoxyheptonate aldolase n=1 Tax=Salinicola acroporae TaxID=1541440 RepID=A0ABT6I5S3_9GAMM|nr:3-deoxy-7-phosphoheptulonate synthase [Salinicola acroporae]MDH4572901.1 3-deoxy-7-phosphoheptulonate synthase [Salinicola acroporae]
MELMDLNIMGFKSIISPKELKYSLPLTERARSVVDKGRQDVKRILSRADQRLIVVVGPCSIHDPEAAYDYAKKLSCLSDELNDKLLIIMRVYFEKPRTAIGWKGLINDPHLDDSFEIEEGLRLARRLLLDLSELGLPLATEALDPVSPQYLQDLISWSAIGARTTESQTHREMSSGLSCAVGFKNSTDGGLDVAINAIKSSMHPHNFLGIDETGQIAIVSTKGNAFSHVILRGGHDGANYDSVSIKKCKKKMEAANITPNIMVDCSHANSGKNPENQPLVAEDVVSQIVGGNTSIVGIMLESNIESGSQSLDNGFSNLKYGVSITDACIDWITTEDLLRSIYSRLTGS